MTEVLAQWRRQSIELFNARSERDATAAEAGMLNQRVIALLDMLEHAKSVSIPALIKTTNEINTSNGWDVLKPEEWTNSNTRVPAVIALIHSEVSEALEAFRKSDRANFEEELADVVIRVMDCAGGLGVDLEKVILKKLEKNRGRGHRHGGKRV